ncbi:hypothetical protein BJY52DRAFT_1227294 [Lactarius psammicola]|nr:hypothetical protein BJY52DRAFT_1227294 [Lactarius psammicola]
MSDTESDTHEPEAPEPEAPEPEAPEPEAPEPETPEPEASEPENTRHYQPQTPEPDSLSEVESTQSAHLGNDLSPSLPIKGMYPLLDLITEQGSSGLVDKIVIAQQSLQGFINALSPGAYSSITKVNFKRLDNVVLKPFGIYGSKEEIVRFLCEIKAVDDNTVQELLAARSSEPVLRSGLYIVRSFLSTSEEQAYVVYWPEDTTWDDRAASPVQRNRVTFMRYLSKLCDQLVCLLSSEHTRAIAWGDDDDGEDTEGEDNDSDSASTDSEKVDSSRFYHFEVAKTKDQEENVVVREGFKAMPLIYDNALFPYALPPGVDADPRAFCPALLHGEKVQGFMTTTFVPERTIVEQFSYDQQTPDQIRLRWKDAVLCLPEKIDGALQKSLITASNLKRRFPKEYETWEKSKYETERRFKRIFAQRKAEMRDKVEEDPEDIRPKVRRHVVGELLKAFPSIQRERLLPELSSVDAAVPEGDSNDEEELEQSLWGNIHGADLGKCLKAPEFQFKKKRILFLQLLNSSSRSSKGSQDAKDSQGAKGSQDAKDSQNTKDSEDAKSQSADLTRSMADTVLSHQDEKSTLAYLEKFKKSDKGGVISRLLGFFRSSEEELWQSARKSARSISDSQFLLDLKDIPVDHYLHGATIDVEEAAYDLLIKQVDTSVTAISQQINSTHTKERDKQVQLEVDIEEAGEVQVLWSNFVRQIKEVSALRSTSLITVYFDHFEVRKSSYSRDTYYISGRQESLREAEIEHRIHLLHLRADEVHRVQLDPSYVPTPILEERLTHSFHVSSSTTVKYAHLLEGGRILLVLVDTHGNIVVYNESLSRIDAAIQRRSFARLFHRDKIGETCLFALDESKHMLAVYSSIRMQFHIFAFEDERGSLRGVGSAIDLVPFYNNGESIVHACFVHGREEILPASLQLPQVPRAVYSSPDGSCALFVQEKDGVSTVTAYHWTTFASTDGISLSLPEFTVNLEATLLTSIVNRSNIHLIGLDVTTQTCRSVVLNITCKATEFTFQEERTKASTSDGKETAHNCLIDCHTDVWTRFPVVAAVKRRTITSSSERQKRTLTFVTDDDQRPFSFYFSEMVRNFTKTSRKPTGDVLKGITVSGRTFTSFAHAFLSSPEWPVSRFRAGEWLADLLCLIPIHIAITLDNRFVPLKDGVLSQQLEVSLLGAEVNRIVDSLSLGWYESIFQSYWASKPVKVVSSMGEQSVGKSFSLNHLVDTSFAGSAMRTTEGVWLSVSPTDDALIVALDFEGVHSLERSAQEDTLLVLFNTAISNLSFQSSSSILDPASNPSLFQSTLLVVIKDVIDSDEAEVTKEPRFRLKFQKIVEDEQDSNFITRLHAGKLKIIPWPVIESKEFYKLFSKVKKTLDQQPPSHHTAGEFLLRLKTLMAKLKANDWGAMSQTMAIHRANSLRAILSTALETGFSEVDPELIPLKNFDADIVIEAEDTEARFILAGPDTPVADHERHLATLRESWDLTDQRQHVDDSTWHSDLVQYLSHLVDLRVTHVESWLESNVQRFEGGHASIEELRRTFGNAVIDLRASVELLLATLEITCRHPSLRRTMRALRKTRLYGESPEHEGNHLCSAPVHMCGQPCRLASLRLPNGKTITCPGTCQVPIVPSFRDEDHEDHECEDRECLASCQLCNRMCTGGHFHGLNPDEHHLCGNEHPCGSLCSAGICEIQTKPQAIEAMFTGRHGSFQYTEYTQAVKRLPCAKVIEPGEVDHPGPHIHSNDERPFHYCNTRCAGHPQQEHETSHGSMSQTKWAIDGSDDTSVELEGRKFSSNDEGGPMLCNMRMSPDPDEAKDWITHALHWRRMGRLVKLTFFLASLKLLPGFKDPYPREEQANFAKCDALCPGPEHTTEKGGASAQPSGCTQALFHAPISTESAPPGPGYVSNDGHHFACRNPGRLQASFHVIFAIDLSRSMARNDRKPLPNAAGTSRITPIANNRLGAVISSLYSFWTARQAAVSQGAQLGGHRRDAYSIIFFSRTPMTCVENDFTSSPDQLLTSCLRYRPFENENYTLAIEKAQAIMTSNWSTERAPVLIFLSDGESHIGDQPVYNICRAATSRGMPLSFHAVSFGPENRSAVLRRMVQIAQETENGAARNSLTNGIPSSFTRALDTRITSSYTPHLSRAYCSPLFNFASPRCGADELDSALNVRTFATHIGFVRTTVTAPIRKRRLISSFGFKQLGKRKRRNAQLEEKVAKGALDAAVVAHASHALPVTVGLANSPRHPPLASTMLIFLSVRPSLVLLATKAGTSEQLEMMMEEERDYELIATQLQVLMLHATKRAPIGPYLCAEIRENEVTKSNILYG